MAYGRDADSDRAVQVALVAMMASAGLDADRSVLYYDFVYASFGEAARKTLQAMDPAKYEFQSEFAKRYLAQGGAEGEIRGEAKVLLKQLTLKFGTLPQAVVDRVQSASIDELDRWAEHVLTADRLEQVLEP
jgi:hypothetical protein